MGIYLMQNPIDVNARLSYLLAQYTFQLLKLDGVLGAIYIYISKHTWAEFYCLTNCDFWDLIIVWLIKSMAKKTI